MEKFSLIAQQTLNSIDEVDKKRDSVDDFIFCYWFIKLNRK